MPNAKVLSEKQAIVAELTEKLQNAASGVLVDYKGITVAEDTALRAEMRKNGVEYAVVKNTLTRFAVKNAGLEELSSVLGRKVRIVTGRNKGRVELEYYGIDDLNDLLEALALLQKQRKGTSS